MSKIINRWYSRYKTKWAVFVERFYQTLRDLPKKPFFKKGAIPIPRNVVTKENTNKKHSTTKLIPEEASLKNEIFVHKNCSPEKNQTKVWSGRFN